MGLLARYLWTPECNVLCPERCPLLREKPNFAGFYASRTFFKNTGPGAPCCSGVVKCLAARRFSRRVQTGSLLGLSTAHEPWRLHPRKSATRGRAAGGRAGNGKGRHVPSASLPEAIAYFLLNLQLSTIHICVNRCWQCKHPARRVGQMPSRTKSRRRRFPRRRRDGSAGATRPWHRAWPAACRAAQARPVSAQDRRPAPDRRRNRAGSPAG